MIFRQVTHDDPGCASYLIGDEDQRSALAASVLKRHGAEHVIHVADGGVGTWEARGWPIEMPEPARGRS